ncbi:MFS transporter [Actinomadura verrucosospora]|uniref:Chloramphenicol resistance protein n=1 Tax=Actinomadura verrucosospora TaxID=46165 RepID=A0A7D3VVA7_ACTVE|nr:MFS transporter [Actinomadura verrucosospora]QKG24215.1 Chloramphenicol resistance protein [Actinomadura verrucosospora]
MNDFGIGGRAWWRAGLAVATVGWGAQQFAPLLPLYRTRLGLSATTVQATFGMYVLGLVPGLLLGGPVSDRYGRRRVLVPALAASAAGTVLLVLGGTGSGRLFAGRLVAGVASGAAFSAGSAWIKELSAAAAGSAPRRLTIAMSIGFGLGPLVAGVLAQWAPDPTAAPYVPHLLLAGLALPLAARAPETAGMPETARRAGTPPRLRDALRVPEARGRRFLTVLVPLAPWVFGSASIALAYLPALVGGRLGGHALVYGAAVTTLTAAAGIAVQPLARRIRTPRRLLMTAMGLVTAGMLVATGAAAAAGAAAGPVLVVAAALVLGAAYGCCQVCGLQEVQRLARPERLAALTSAYQAVSYVGFAAPFPLAAAGRLASPPVLLLAVTGLAALTLAALARTGRVGREEPGAIPAAGRPDDQPGMADARNVRR